jgi:hypothetical protein
VAEGPRLRRPSFVRPERLEAIAEEFLREHHPGLGIPVPIEEIVEFRLGLNIVPFPNLRAEFDVDGFLTFVPTTIYVDQSQMEGHEARYRFTLAHEVGHWLLHRDLYADAGITDLASYIAAYEAMDDDAQSNMEFQARNLGGRILLPRAPFVTALSEAFEPFRSKVPKGADTRLVCGRLSKFLGPRFNVSEKVIETRLVGDGLCEEVGLKKPARTS